MDYRPWLSVIEIIFWGIIALSCVSVLLKGKIIAIQLIYPVFYGVVYVLILYFQNPIFDDVLGTLLYLLQTIVTGLFVIITIAKINSLRNRYLFLGISTKALLGEIQNILRENKLSLQKESNKSFILMDYSDDIYTYNSFIDVNTGSYIYVKSKNNNKSDQAKIIPKLLRAFQNTPLNISGKLFVGVLLIVSAFFLYVTYRQII